MKRVVIVRHAKSVPYGYDDDFNRGLKDRGHNDAKIISDKLKDEDVKPDLIISSPAKRALMTAKIYAENLNYPESKILLEDDLYDGITTQEFVHILNNLAEEIKTVFVFGHNPIVYYLCSNLVKYFNGDMPTSSTVGIDFDIENWREVSARQGKLAFHLIPRDYK